ncbi:MAG: hypothetical protein KR126chlam1_01418 [Chlamydiae bacterium]|nr:hypothetical protein [Chlamydiota bacterium]
MTPIFLSDEGRRAEQTRKEFVELEELFIGEKMALIRGGMNMLTVSKY